MSSKRIAIIAGDHETTNEESEFKYCAEDVDKNESMIQKRLKSIRPIKRYDADIKGIPNLLLTIICDTELFSNMIQPYDAIFMLIFSQKFLKLRPTWGVRLTVMRLQNKIIKNFVDRAIHVREE